MNEMPCTEDEWKAVTAASNALTEAVLMDDDVLASSLRADFVALLEELKSRYGDHPVLLETQADLEPISDSQVLLYRRALAVASEHGLPTYTIQISLASSLVELSRFDEAKSALAACEREVVASGEGFYRDWWARAMKDCLGKSQGCP